MPVKYKIIFRADKSTAGENALTWEPGCPIEISAVQIARDTESTKTYLQIKVRNISNETITSIVLDAIIVTPDGEETTKRIKYLDVDVAPANEATLKPQQLDRTEVTSCSIAVSRVESHSNEWLSKAGPLPIPARKQLNLSSKALEQRARLLQRQLNDSIVNGAVQQHKDWWVCSCGQLNVNRIQCCSCKTDMQFLLDTEDESSLLNAYDNYSQRKKKSKAKKKRIAAIGGAIAVAAAISLTAINLIVIPNMRYDEAINLANSGQYDEAIEKLSQLGDNDKNQTAINAILKDEALSYCDSGDYDSAYEAAAQLCLRGDDAEAAARELGKQIADKASNDKLFKEAARWYSFGLDSDGYRRSMYQYAVSNLNHDDRDTYDFLSQLKKIDYENSSELFDNLYKWEFDFATCSGVTEPDPSADSAFFPLDRTGFTSIYLFGRASNAPLSGSKSFTIKILISYWEDSFSYQHGSQTYEKEERLSISSSGKWESVRVINNTASMKTVSLTIIDSDTNETVFEKTLSCQE